MENTVRLLSTLALKGAVVRVSGEYQAATGTRIDADFAPTIGLLKRLRGGETADLVILTQEGLEELIAEAAVVAVDAPGTTEACTWGFAANCSPNRMSDSPNSRR